MHISPSQYCLLCHCTRLPWISLVRYLRERNHSPLSVSSISVLSVSPASAKLCESPSHRCFSSRRTRLTQILIVRYLGEDYLSPRSVPSMSVLRVLASLSGIAYIPSASLLLEPLYLPFVQYSCEMSWRLLHFAALGLSNSKPKCRAGLGGIRDIRIPSLLLKPPWSPSVGSHCGTSWR